MKTILHNLLCAVLLLSPLAGLLGNDVLPLFTVRSTADNAFVLTLSERVQEPTRIRLIDTEGVLLYSDVYRPKDAKSRQFNLRALPQGTYFLELESELLIYRQPLTLTKNGIQIDPAAREQLAKPFLDCTPEGKLKVSYLHLDDQPVEIEVINAQGRLVFREAVNTEGPVMRRYDLGELPPGSYRAIVRTQNATVQRPVNLR